MFLLEAKFWRLAAAAFRLSRFYLCALYLRFLFVVWPIRATLDSLYNAERPRFFSDTSFIKGGQERVRSVVYILYRHDADWIVGQIVNKSSHV